LKTYSTGTFACTLKIADTVRAGTASYTKIGNVVFLTIPNFYFDNLFTPGVDSAQFRNVPSIIRPTTTSYVLFGADSTASSNLFYNAMTMTVRNNSSFKVMNAVFGGSNIIIGAFGYTIVRQMLVYLCD
jgi:hypothetical protein